MAKQNKSKSIERIRVQSNLEIKRLILKYLNNRRVDVQAILKARKEKDFETIRALGHSMKGSGTTYGFDTITNCGNNLEPAAFEKGHSRVQKAVELLTD